MSLVTLCDPVPSPWRYYFDSAPGVPAEYRLRALRFAEMLGGGPPLHGLLCGGGTTETQKLAIRKNLNLEEKKRLVKKLAGIPEGR